MMLTEYLSTEEMLYLQQAAKQGHIKVVITNHFFKRWNHRVESPKFRYKKDLKIYLETMILKEKIQKIKNRHHIIDDDIIVVAKKSKSKQETIFITTYGSTKNNPALYNMCVNGDLYKNFRKYGKLNLDYVS